MFANADLIVYIIYNIYLLAVQYSKGTVYRGAAPGAIPEEAKERGMSYFHFPATYRGLCYSPDTAQPTGVRFSYFE